MLDELGNDESPYDDHGRAEQPEVVEWEAESGDSGGDEG